MADDYTKLITGQHRNKPRFSAMVALLAGAFGQVTDVMQSMGGVFDLDAATGVQLDTVGLWVGITRRQTVPIPNVFFTWNDPALGWDFANWKGPFESAQGVQILDDTSYRAVLKAKVMSNYWDGSNATVNEPTALLLPELRAGAVVVDNLDMSTSVYVGGWASAVLLALVKRGALPPKPAGVRVASYYKPAVLGAPFFALDLDVPYLFGGLDSGCFSTTF